MKETTRDSRLSHRLIYYYSRNEVTRIGVMPKSRGEEKLQLRNLLEVFITPTIALIMHQIEIQKYSLITLA